jgi:hypothetical protein
MSHPLEGALCKDYVPPGPVGGAFIRDLDARLVGIMGPNGSGKTSACPMKAQLITRLQPRNKHDGVRRSKGYVVRGSYRDLWDKTIPSWLAVFPDFKTWPMTGPKYGPATHVVKWDDIDEATGRKQVYEMIVEFRAIADANLESFARGQLATWYWLNEADTLPAEAVDFFLGRLGRYPEPHTVVEADPAGPVQVFGDFNAPLVNNWTYTRLVMSQLKSGRASGARCYVQPSGFSPEAENPTLRRGRPTYYQDLAANMEDWQIKRFIEAKPGYARSGEPIYTEFDYDTHVLKSDVRPTRGYPLLIGVDGKLNAAAVIGQVDFMRALTVLRSLVTPNGQTTDAETFGRNLKELLAGEYAGFAAVCMLDPTNFARSSESGSDQLSWAAIFAEASGLPCYPAPTNMISRRHGAVRRKLNGRVGAKPTLVINPTGNDTLIDGFVANYRVNRILSRESTKYADQPEKNHASHVHDAQQYLALLAGGDPEFVDMAIELQADVIGAMRALKHGDAGDGRVLNDW